MTTHLSYFEDTYKFNDHAIIQSSHRDVSGHFITLNQTIFYPQGGGQPSDQGTMTVGNQVIPIHSVKVVDHEVRHYTNQDYSSLSGQEVICLVNKETRLLHARLHTAGHLISNIVESLYPECCSIKGHHFPNQCYVEFTSNNALSGDIPLELINKEIQKSVEKDLLINIDQVSKDKLKILCPNFTYSIPYDQHIRVVRIGDFPFSPCGGTHVKSLKELKGLETMKCKIKKGVMKINYGL